jgi:shikimate kinase
LAEGNRDIIAAKGVAVWLDASVETLWDRVRHKDTRPLLQTADPKGTLTRIYQERHPVYALAGLRIDVDADASIPQTTQSVVDTLATRPDILEIT